MRIIFNTNNNFIVCWKAIIKSLLMFIITKETDRKQKVTVKANIFHHLTLLSKSSLILDRNDPKTIIEFNESSRILCLTECVSWPPCVIHRRYTLQ